MGVRPPGIPIRRRNLNEDLSIRIIPDFGDDNQPKAQKYDQTSVKPEKQRYVFAHVVQGNSQFYEAEDWCSDIELAQTMGIDAFAINIGRDSTNAKQLPLIYEVAEKKSFQVFLSFDMGYYGHSDSSKEIKELIQDFGTRKAQFMYQDKPLVSTFSGEVPGTYLNANPDYNSAWQSLRENIEFPIYFLPCWTGVDPQKVPAVDGMMSWDAWSPISCSQDRRYKKNLSEVGKQYAAPLSAMFYKHLSDCPDGNYLHPTDSWFLVERYLELINLKPAFIEILSWNDYGESHYLRDPRPSANLPFDTISSREYVNGMPHEPLLDLISYFNKWYKSGSRPPIERSKAYAWYRPHPRDTVSKPDSLPIPARADLTEDKIYIAILASCTSKLRYIEVQSGEKTNWVDLSKIETCMSKEDALVLISVPFKAGPIQKLKLYDQNQILIGSLNGIGIVNDPEVYNFNYWAGLLEF